MYSKEREAIPAESSVTDIPETHVETYARRRADADGNTTSAGLVP